MFSIKKRCNYQNEVLQKAMAEVKNGKRTVGDAARHYQIPRSTLDDKIKGLHSGKYGAKRKLSDVEETALFEYVTYRVIIQNLCPPSPVKSTWPWVELTVIPNNATNLKNICQKS